jgi:hypothetical protein
LTNPWEEIDLAIYEKHMSLATVNQLGVLNKIMKSQLDYDVNSVAIWGIAGGNGLEHISCNNFTSVYGIDINQNYLKVAKERFSHLKCLYLEKFDLVDLSITLPSVDLVIANLLLEYIGLDNFIKQIDKNSPKYLSCLIQNDNGNEFVSSSIYSDNFKNLPCSNIEKDVLINELDIINFNIILEEKYNLPNTKEFIRLDFENVKI